MPHGRCATMNAKATAKDYRRAAEDAEEGDDKAEGYGSCKGSARRRRYDSYGIAPGPWRRNRSEWSVVEILGTTSLLERHLTSKWTDGVLRGVLFCKQANSGKLKIWVTMLCETVCGLFACWC